MENLTVGRLLSASNRALREGKDEQALAGFATVLSIQPSHLGARLRVADALLALGHPQSAALVYTALARHAAHSGHPLHALVSIKILSTLEPSLSQLISALGGLYARGSAKLGTGARPSAGDDSVALPAAMPPIANMRGGELLEAATALGVDLARTAGYPEKLPPIPLFSELPGADFAAVLETVRLSRKRPGDVLMREGDAGQLFYVLARGQVSVSRKVQGQSVELAKLGDGAVFGEMALISSAPRSATVTALTDCDLLELDAGVLMRVSEGMGALAQGLSRFMRQRLVNNLIQTAPLFQPLSHDERIDLVRRFQAIEVADGTDLIREGEQARGLFVLLHGKADVWKLDGDEKVLLATLGAGEVFGEISLLNDAPATASVTAVGRAVVLFLKREYFDKLVAALPAMRAYLEQLGDTREMDMRLWVGFGSDGEPPVEALPEVEVQLDFD